MDFSHGSDPCFAPGATQSLAIGPTSTASTALSATASRVRLCATSDCYIAFGLAPAATATSLLLPAYTVEYFAVQPGSKIAALQVGAAGTLSIAEVA